MRDADLEIESSSRGQVGYEKSASSASGRLILRLTQLWYLGVKYIPGFYNECSVIKKREIVILSMDIQRSKVHHNGVLVLPSAVHILRSPTQGQLNAIINEDAVCYLTK